LFRNDLKYRLAGEVKLGREVSGTAKETKKGLANQKLTTWSKKITDKYAV